MLVKLTVINSHAQPGKNAENIKSVLSRITAEIPSSGEPQHPPALVVRLRGRQHSGAVLWVEPASKCERYFLKQQRHLLKLRFSQNMKANLQTRGNRKRQATRRPLKHWKFDTNTNKQTFLKGANMRDSGGLTLTYIGSHLHNGMLILESVHSSCQLWFPLNHRKLKAALKYLVA